jgi:hypothetical protein
MARPTYDWTVIKGDDETITFQYLDSNGDIVDLSDSTAVATVKINGVESHPDVAIDDVTASVTVTIDHDLSATFAGNGTYKVVLTSGDDIIKTLIYGELRLVTL